MRNKGLKQLWLQKQDSSPGHTVRSFLTLICFKPFCVINLKGWHEPGWAIRTASVEIRTGRRKWKSLPLNVNSLCQALESQAWWDFKLCTDCLTPKGWKTRSLSLKPHITLPLLHTSNFFLSERKESLGVDRVKWYYIEGLPNKYVMVPVSLMQSQTCSALTNKNPQKKGLSLFLL